MAAVTAALFSNAQQVKLSWSSESKNFVVFGAFALGVDNQLIKLCFQPDFGSAFSSDGKTNPIITSYNDNLVEANSQSIYSSQNKVKFSSLLSIKKNLYFFTNLYDSKSKSTTFYCQPLDIKNFKAKGENMDLGTLSALKKSEQSTVEYLISDDSTKVLMMGVAPSSKSEVEKYYMGVYDYQMKKLWEKTIELPFKSKDVEILNSLVTNDGRVAVLIKHFDSGTDKEQVRKDGKKVPSYSTKLLLYNKENATPEEFIINIGDKFAHSLAIAKEKDNELILFGLYKQKSDGNVNGYFLTQINLDTKKSSSTNINSFPENLLKLIEKDDQGSDSNRDGGIASAFKFMKMETRANGDRDFIIEYCKKAWISGGSSFNQNYASQNYILYHHGDILDINIKANGTNVITRIPKLQISTESANAASFKSMVYKDKLLVFYNDDEDNLEQDLSKKPKETKMGVGGRKLLGGTADALLTMATIDANGNLTRTVLMDKKQSKFITAVNVSLVLENQKLALYAIKGTKDMVGLLEIK